MSAQQPVPPLLSLDAPNFKYPAVLFGFHVPWLPDFLSDHTLLGERPDDRIQEHCRRWSQLVAALWTDADPEAAYALRFGYDPAEGRVRIALLGRSADAERAQAHQDALQRALSAFDVAAEPMTALEVQGHVHRNWKALAEVHQAEQLFPVLRAFPGAAPVLHTDKDGHQSMYSVLPWWGPGGSFLMPFLALVGQATPAALLVLLRPLAGLRAEEGRLLAELGNLGRVAEGTTAEVAHAAQGEAAVVVQYADVGAAWAGRLHGANLRRLTQPFLTAVYCAADDDATATGLASAVVAALGEENAFETPLGEDRPLQARAQSVLLAGEARARALDGVQQLLFTRSPSRFPFLQSGEQRLRYLTDARGAAAVFRFPVSVRGGIAGIEVRQAAPDFDPGPRKPWVAQGAGTPHKERRIAVGRLQAGGVASIPLKDLAKHALVTGFTGGGKSNTVRVLLDQLWRDHQVPFLVLESAKNEYRGFLGMPEFTEVEPALRVYSVGNERCAPFRLNPFELLPGVRLEAHLGRLQTCFEAVMPSEGPLPSLVGDTLLIVYEEKGWRLTDAGGDPGREKLRFPLMRDFERVIQQLLGPKTADNPRGRGYVGETLFNLQGFVRSRISPLLVGSKGLMFSRERSVPAEELFECPAVLEMNDLNQSDKSIVTLFVLTLLREYRERNQTGSKPLAHVTVVEEAHNVLENVSQAGEGQSNARFMAVQSFCNMLAEVRAYGEGLIIADQSPEKLAPDAMRNTNLQIAHNLRHADDRDAVARAMVMSDEQRDFIGKLGVGRTAVFYTGLDRATFVKIPRYDAPDELDAPELTGRGAAFRDAAKKNAVTDEEVRGYMLPLIEDYLTGPFGAVCEPCESKVACPHRGPVVGALTDKDHDLAGYAAAVLRAKGPKHRPGYLRNLSGLALDVARRVPLPTADPTAGVAWCAFAHLWDADATPDELASMYKQFKSYLS